MFKKVDRVNQFPIKVTPWFVFFNKKTTIDTVTASAVSL